VGFKPGVTDALGNSVKREIVEDLHVPVEEVRTIDAYTIEASLTREEIERVSRDLLTDPVTQICSFEGTLATNFARVIEVAYKPGVTDNVGTTTSEGMGDLLGTKLKENEAVHTSRLYLLSGNVSQEEAERICLGLLANPLIENFGVFDEKAWRKEAAKKRSRTILSAGEIRVAEIDLDVSDDELLEISTKGVLSLDLAEMKKIRDYYGRPEIREERKKRGLREKPTDVELEMLAQTWSEHCKHKIFNGLIEYQENGEKELIDSLFKTYIRRATDEISKQKGDWLVSVFVDNAGVVSFNQDYDLVFKVETHNHPSALDPYGGAVTGIVGVNRDPMGTGLGANLIFNTDVFCFGPPDFPYEKLPRGVLHPKRIFKGVRKGVEHGGNKIGIPTVNGAVLFDEAYVYNPLVYCGTGGLLPKRIAGRPGHLKEVKDGDVIVMVGGRIGKDGIHGATFSSTRLDEETSPTAVQIGAPIVQKKMMDALLEARDRGLYSAITDNGAGGLSSSVGEMSVLSGGCLVHLEKAPLKYPGLDPWELWVSEAQERMTLAVAPEKIEEFLEVCQRRDVEATVLGWFKSAGKVEVKYGGRTVAYLDLDFLHGGLPRSKRPACFEIPSEKDPEFEVSSDLTGDLKAILSSLNVCSKEWIIRQYDHEVQGGSVVKPLVGVNADGPSDAAVVRPLLEEKKGVVIANGINPKYGEIDPYWMAASAIDEAIRNVVAVGGRFDRIALLDNFCWGNPILSPENPEGDFKLGQLVRAARACYDMAVSFETPFISGKDSFHNEYKIGEKTIAIPPTLLISALGVIDDCEKAVTMDAKREGDLIYLVGRTFRELGGSHYYIVKGLGGGSVPKVRSDEAKPLFETMEQAISRGLVASCHDCSEGGLAVAAAETAFAGDRGMTLDLSNLREKTSMRDDEFLFSESNTRFVATVHPEERKDFEKLLGENALLLGRVTEDKYLEVKGAEGRVLINSPVEELKEAWQATLRW
jgi:phosphoribosylformylglycinamidine synthase